MKGLFRLIFCLLLAASVSGNGLFDRFFQRASGKGRSSKQQQLSFLSSEKNKEWTLEDQIQHLREIGQSQVQKSDEDSAGDGAKMLEALGSVAHAALEQIVKLTVYYFFFKWSVDYFSKVAKKITEDIARQTSDKIPASLQRFLRPNVTLTSEEMELISNMKGPEEIKDDWRQLGGLMQLKKTAAQLFHMTPINVNQSTPITPPQSPNQANNDDARNVLADHSSHSALFYGPPGCGKSTLIRGLCRQLKCPLLEVTPSMIQRKYFGESTALIRAVFTLAGKMTQCVIFLDEIDSLFSARRAEDPAYERAIKTEFMQLWDQLGQQEALQTNNNVFVFGATNRPQDVDPAVLRRFERSFKLSLPGPDERRDIIRRMLRFVRKEQDFDFDRCAQLTDGFSGSDILNLCKAAVGQLRHEERLRLERLAALKPANSNDTASTEKKNGDLYRPLKTSDIEQVASSFQPTSWAAAAFGRENDPHHRMNSNQPQMDFTFNPDMLNGNGDNSGGNPFGSASTFNNFPTSPQQQQQPPPSPFQWDMSDEEYDEDDEEL